MAPQERLKGDYAKAGRRFGAEELRAARAKHADTIRFQVSQFALDPQDPIYAPDYLKKVGKAVHLARGLGFTVIVSLQAERHAGRNGRCLLPDAGAERAWSRLAPTFADDHGVMLQLYNEPVAKTVDSAAWRTWLSGGPAKTAQRAGGAHRWGCSGSSTASVPSTSGTSSSSPGCASRRPWPTPRMSTILPVLALRSSSTPCTIPCSPAHSQPNGRGISETSLRRNRSWSPNGTRARIGNAIRTSRHMPNCCWTTCPPTTSALSGSPSITRTRS
ncbi:cellulase family glycosylhydrolase [Streptomyces platensis]|nr:cellulase family glycosylhydrolase [Streptomyces platensis]